MTPVLATSDLAVGYSGRPVVEHIDLTLLPGQALSLVGVNGSGKSTLLKTIAGLLEPISGEMKVFGDVPGAAPNRGPTSASSTPRPRGCCRCRSAMWC